MRFHHDGEFESIDDLTDSNLIWTLAALWEVQLNQDRIRRGEVLLVFCVQDSGPSIWRS